MSKNRLITMSLCSAVLAVGCAFAQQDTASPGIAVGQTAPAFQLKDQNERQRALKDLLDKGPVALVFYRSADW